MRRTCVTLALTTVTALFSGAALSQKTPITWWEHSNPPHNNYS
jgi:ABC-type glycerol-3-phosphate transport system substrate-binding protein